MSDGFFIRFREMVPEEGLLNLALAEISSLHDTWPDRLQCNIVIAQGAHEPQGGRFNAEVEVELGRGAPIASRADCEDPYAALRSAFRSLRQRIPMVA
ncbi:MAG: HPF/RaiA family ribosome-associated protein [Myxococcales bacterium]